MYYVKYVDRVAGGLLAGTFMACLWGSGVAALADFHAQKNAPESLKKAVELAPDNAEYRMLLAELIEGQGLDPNPQLNEAVRLSHLDSKYLIRLAFRSEIEGDFPRTEALLLSAARIDHKANPRWALMNFYFRRGRDTDFWAWFTRTLSVSQGGMGALFQLGWKMSQDSSLILAHIPNEPRLMSQYLEYLSRGNQLDDAGEVAIRVARNHPSADQLPRLLEYCERYTEGDSRRAVAVWNALAAGKAIPFRPLNPDSGAILTNEDFSAEQISEVHLPKVFDWNLLPADGVSVDRLPEQKAIRLEFNGEQREACDLLEQKIPLSPNRTYSISWRADSSGDKPVSGLSWHLVEPGPEKAEVTSPVLSGQAGALTFRAKYSAGVLRLRYERPLGSRRAIGSITISDLRGGLVQ